MRPSDILYNAMEVSSGELDEVRKMAEPTDEGTSIFRPSDILFNQYPGPKAPNREVMDIADELRRGDRLRSLYSPTAIAPPVSFPGAGVPQGAMESLARSNIAPQPAGGFDEMGRAVDEDLVPYIKDREPSEEARLVGSTLAAIPKILGSIGSQLAMFSGAGLAGLIEAIPRVSTDPTKTTIIDTGEIDTFAGYVPPEGGEQFPAFESTGLEGAMKTFNEVMSLPTKMITTPEEAKAVENLMLAMKPIEMAGEGWGLIGKAVNDGLVELGLEPTLLEPLLGTYGEAAAVFAIPNVIRGLNNSTWFRQLTIRERSLVVQSLAEAKKANPNMTEGQLLRTYNDSTWREQALEARSVGETYKEVKDFVKVKGVEAKVEEITKQQDEVDAIPEGVSKVAMQRVLDAKKTQLAMEAAEKLKGINYEQLIAEDFKQNVGRKVKQALNPTAKLPLKKTLDVQVDKAMEGLAEAEVADIETPHKLRTIPLTKKEAKAKGLSEVVKPKDRLKIKRTVKKPKVVEPPEPITEVDSQTGHPEPVAISSSFRELDPARTEQLLKAYPPLARMTDPYALLSRLNTEANSWLDGNDSIDIAQIRKLASGIAVTAVEQGAGKTGIAEAFKDMTLEQVVEFGELASELAKWVRKADRLKIERTKKDTTLSIGVDPTKVVGLFKKKPTRLFSTEQELENLTRRFSGKGLPPNVVRLMSLIEETEKSLLANEFSSKNIPEVKKNLQNDKDALLSEIFSLRPEIKKEFSPEYLRALVRETKLTGGTKLYSGFDPTEIKKLFKGFHGTSGKYIKPSEIVGKYLKPKSLKQIVEDTLDELKLTGSERDKAKQQIYDYDYFDYAIKKDEFSRPFEGAGEVYVARSFEDASNYAEWAGEAYDSALIALGAFEESPTGLAKRAKEIYSRNREAEPYVLEVETSGKLKKGDNISTVPVKVTGVYDREGTKLYSGVPVDYQKIGKEVLKRAEAFEKSFKKSLEAKRFKASPAYKRFREEFTKAMVERKGNLRRKVLNELDDAGYKLISKMYLAAGGSGLSRNKFKQMHKEVFSWLNSAQKEELFLVIDAMRMKDIGEYKTKKQFAFPEGRDLVNSVAFLESLQKRRGYSDTEMANLTRRAEGYGEHIKSVIEDIREEGLIGNQEAIDLSKHFWRKIRKIEQYDEKYSVTIGDRRFDVTESGIEHLRRGKKKDLLESDAELLALEFYNRMYNRILNNRAMKEWLNVARTMPDNPYVMTKYDTPKLAGADFKALSAEEKANLISQAKVKKVPKGWIQFHAYEGGENLAAKTPFHIHPEIAKEMITSQSKDLTYRVAKVAGIVLGNPALRFMATGAAPIWSTLINFPIDLLTAWGSARVYRDGKWRNLYNSTLPVYAMQMGRDLVATAKDAHFRGPQFDMLAEQGGLLSFLAHQARLFVPGERLPSTLSKIGDIMTYHSESMEAWTRLAIQRRVLRRIAKEKGITLEEAMKDKEAKLEAAFAARDYIDFNQGGWLVKAIDQLLPYTGAGVQAGRVYFRQAKDDPVRFAWRTTQIALLATGLTTAHWLFNEENQKDTPLYARSRNRVIQLPKSWSFEDEDGNRRGLFLKIPLPREIAVVNAFFETLTEHILYISGVIKDPPNYDAVLEAMKAGMPIDPTGLPPLISGLQSYRTGIDLFTGRKTTEEILPWPKSAAEFTPFETPQAFQDLRKVTGVSPNRIGPALRNIFTDSIWSHAAGAGYEKAFGDVPDDIKSDNIWITLSKIPKVSRVVGVTVPDARAKERIDELTHEQMTEDMIRNNAVDAYAKFAYWKGSEKAEQRLDDYLEVIKDKDYYDWINSVSKVEFIKGISDLKHRKLWLSIKNKKPELRAAAFATKYNAANEDVKDQMWDELRTASSAGGWVSDRFIDEVSKLVD